MGILNLVFELFLVKGLVTATVSPHPSVIVVGSGPSGIAAATRLLKNGVTNVKILEAENRIGGRVHSIKFGDAYVDLGAEFCHGQEGNIVYDMAKDLNVLQPSDPSVTMYRSNGEALTNKTTMKIAEFAQSLEGDEKAIEGCENVESVGECLDTKFKTFVNTASENEEEKEILSGTRDYIYSYIAAYDSPLDLYDLKIITNYEKCGGDLYMNWNGLGYKTILGIMMQKYPSKENALPIDDKIFLEKTVTKISNWKDGEKVTLTTKDGATYNADHVIVTPSVGVLKANYEAMFEPALPEEKVDAIKNTGYGAILKVIMHFEERWWTEDASWSLVWRPEDKEKLAEKNLTWLINENALVQAENNPNVLIGWCSGSHIPEIESVSNETLLEGQKYLLDHFLAPHYNVTMPDEIIRTTWYSNPNFRGTYSYDSVKGYSRGGKDFQEKLGKPLTNKSGKPTVLFAGEATHPRYSSTVHGAIESGYREADRLIQMYSS